FPSQGGWVHPPRSGEELSYPGGARGRVATPSRRKEPAEVSRICSRHFVDGQPTPSNPHPSVELGYSAVFKRSRLPPKIRICQTLQKPSSESLESNESSPDPPPSNEPHICGKTCCPSSSLLQDEHGYSSNSTCENCPQNLHACKDELVLVLMKLRLGLTNHFLCNIFSISTGLCSRIVKTYISFMAGQLKALINWPCKRTIQQHMPESMRKKYLRCTIDCTEVFIERPHHLGTAQATWSDYKHHHTIKYLVAISPNGAISFLSKGYGGRSSDRGVVHASGFLRRIDPGDVILADRGFTIGADVARLHAHLEIPPPGSGCTQQTREAVSKTKKVANARIHVERAIGRIKWFAILRRTVPITLVPLLDDIITVCAALSNLRPPLIQNDIN
uniref:Uncharacterized protein n=1 Tax=Neogobius melanostomus TaxID=47308 RepID=A0A8C6WRK2_9GOBI